MLFRLLQRKGVERPPAILTTGCFWPDSGIGLDCRKLTLAGDAAESKVGFLARLRTHPTGQKQSVAVTGTI